MIKKETFKSEDQLSKNNKLKYKILKFIRLDRTKKIFKKKDTKYNDIIFDEFEKILQRSLNLSETNNAKLIFVYYSILYYSTLKSFIVKYNIL